MLTLSLSQVRGYAIQAIRTTHGLPYDTAATTVDQALDQHTGRAIDLATAFGDELYADAHYAGMRAAIAGAGDAA